MTSSLPSIADTQVPLSVDVSSHTDDSGLLVSMVPRSSWIELRGEVTGPSRLTMSLNGRALEICLHEGMLPAEIFESIESLLPSEFEAIAMSHPGAGPLGPLTLQLTRRLHPESSVPRVRILEASDRKQRVCFIGNNRLMIAGTALGTPPSRIELEIDGRRLTLVVKKGDSARRTGKSLSTALPPGYRALLETRESDVAVTVYRHTR